jgi:hypothetical protein
VRWVDVNKGDDVEANVRSRLVARQLKALDTSGTSYFAPAPPLEALRTILSLAMTRYKAHQPIWDPCSPKRQQVSGMDVVRAYFNAKIDRRTLQASSSCLRRTQTKDACVANSFATCMARAQPQMGGRRSIALA